MSVVLSAGAAGDSFSFASRARTNLSITFTPAASGAGGRFSLANDQCSPYFAPSFTQRRSRSICCAVSGGFLELAGGIRSVGSADVIRFSSSLASALPGTNASAFTASSRTSRRRSALRAFSSGPWQA
jgi:hypothetical protein